MKWKLVFLLFLFSTFTYAQMTTVTATVVDSDGTTWANGSWSLQFYPNPNYPNLNQYNYQGSPLSSSIISQQGTIDNTGHFSLSVYTSSFILPLGSQWQLTVCPNASAKCGSVIFASVGASEDISSTLTASLPPPRFLAVAGSYGYTDIEAQVQVKPGSNYWNVIDNCQRYYSGGIWYCVSTTAGSYLPLTGGTLTGPLNGTDATFSGTVSGGTINGILSAVGQFGAKCDGVTDDSAALNAIGTYYANHPNASFQVDFPSGAVCNFASEITTWLTPNLHIEGHGTQLHFTGTGTAIYLYSASSEVDNVTIRGLWLRGNSAATWAIDNESTMARGAIQIIEAQDFATGCFNLTDLQLMNQVDLTCSSIKATQMGVPQVTQPATGINLGSATSGHVFANNRVVNLTIEGVSGTGVNAVQVCCGTNVHGTSEDNGTGVASSANTKEVNWYLDAESNSTADFIDAGQGENFIGITSTGLFHITTGYNAFISGGNFNSITIDSTANNITAQNFIYGTNSGTITASSSSSNVMLRGIQSGTGNPYFFTTFPVQGPSETITGLQKIFDTPNTGQSAARNYCETLDGTGYGLMELWASSTSTGTACSNGTAITQVSPGNYYRIFGSGGFQVLPNGTVSWNGGSGIVSSSDVALTSQLPTQVTVSIPGSTASGTATVPSGTVGCSFSATNASASTDVKTNGAYGSVSGTTFTLTLGANATGSDTFYALCK